MGIDPRIADLRSGSGSQTGTTTPDIERGDVEESPEAEAGEEGEEPEGEKH